MPIRSTTRTNPVHYRSRRRRLRVTPRAIASALVYRFSSETQARKVRSAMRTLVDDDAFWEQVEKFVEHTNKAESIRRRMERGLNPGSGL